MSTKSSSSRTETSDSAWNKHKSTIRDLYLNGVKLHDVIDKLKTEEGFEASPHQYKQKLAEWGLAKYIPSEEMEAIVQELRQTQPHLLEKRTAQQDLHVRGRKIPLSQVKRYVRRQQSMCALEDSLEGTIPDPNFDNDGYDLSDLTTHSTTSSSSLPLSVSVSKPWMDPWPNSQHATPFSATPFALQRDRSPFPVGAKRKRGTASVASSREPPTEIEKDYSSPRTEQAVPETAKKLFACPFHKYDPIAFSSFHGPRSKYRSCENGFDAMNRFKQHLLRTHSTPRNTCPRCGAVCQDAENLAKHLRKAIACTASPQAFEGMIPPERIQKVAKKRPPGQPQAAHWYAIWDILFPQLARPDSPYVDHFDPTNVDAVEVVANIFKASGRERSLDMLGLLVPGPTQQVIRAAFTQVFSDDVSQPPSILDVTVGSDGRDDLFIRELEGIYEPETDALMPFSEYAAEPWLSQSSAYHLPLYDALELGEPFSNQIHDKILPQSVSSLVPDSGYFDQSTVNWAENEKEAGDDDGNKNENNNEDPWIISNAMLELNQFH